ncbi:MAG: tRNA uridine-5-carboxymethylaminomethyl(34) synthesis GTPase MnmE [Vampirovibrionales bacterium]|nr:tRNA uridine-5-carboxymethylaminomethyl(34) synthesis GTPase MnmE [Vampirovibrionales bacterium]
MPANNTSLFETTIVALATPPGRGAIGVVRLSGPRAWAIAKQLFTPANPQATLSARQALFGTLHAPNHPVQLIDEVLVLPFKSPQSFTGEDVVEFQCHGSPTVLNAVVQACVNCGATPALPGEFTQRSFLHGRLDLTQAESVLDLIDAKGERMMAAATANLHHKTLQTALASVCEGLIHLQAQITASVDFPDEVDEPQRGGLISQAHALSQQVTALVASSQHSHWVRNGLTVVLMGRPNAGKSSLFNALLTQDRAIVTPLAGTTRDTLQETLMVEGIPITLVDTAGLRDENTDVIEQLGIARTWEAVARAQAVWMLVSSAENLTIDDTAAWQRLEEKFPHVARQGLWTQVDREATKPSPLGWIATSAKTGQGLPELMEWLKAFVAKQVGQTAHGNAQQQQWVLTQRQQTCLAQCQEALIRLEDAFSQPSLPLDFATVPLTDALRSLDSLLGRDTTDDMLSSVFSQFCVGK